MLRWLIVLGMTLGCSAGGAPEEPTRPVGSGGAGASGADGAVAAAGSAGTGGSAGVPAVACEPGATRECVGAGACAGGQSCEAGEWSPCDCGDPGGVGGAGGAPGGAEGSAGGALGGSSSGGYGWGGGGSASGGTGGGEPQEQVLWTGTFDHVNTNPGFASAPACEYRFTAGTDSWISGCFWIGGAAVAGGSTGATEFLPGESSHVDYIAGCSRSVSTYTKFLLTAACPSVGLTMSARDYPAEVMPVGTEVTRVVRDIQSNSWGDEINILIVWTVYGYEP